MAPLSFFKYISAAQLDRNQKEKLRQFTLFIINGGLLGILSWAGQLWIYGMLDESAFAYTLATILVYPPLILLNFAIQRRLIFSAPGLFFRFVEANMAIMVLVSLLSPLARWILGEIFNPMWGDRLGFAVAALIGSIPSFLLKRWWVFGLR